jgi:uncharacterized protein YjbI with pentapeptide repeats
MACSSGESSCVPAPRADLRGCDITGADLADANLSGSIFLKANLEGVTGLDTAIGYGP